MLLALVNNKLTSPTKNQKANCPLCKGDVIAKCGQINIHHWAHKKNEGCDSWSEPETYWHKSWKEAFPIHMREVVMEKQNKKHFADLYTDNQVVIELQNSTISSETIKQRELFYGEKLLWIINADKYRERISLVEISEYYGFESIKELATLDDEIVLEYFNDKKEFNFHWRYPVKSWSVANQPVFLDIHEDFMLWFTKGIGSKYGTFKVYSKQDFFQHYGGNYDRYKRLTNTDGISNYEPLVNIINHYSYEKLWDFSTYTYSPWLYLRVKNNISRKIHLSKVRSAQLLIPNGNNKGIIFLFCYNLITPKNTGVFITFSNNDSIIVSVLELIHKEGSLYFLDQSQWIVDYIVTVPFNKKDRSHIVPGFVNYLTSVLKKELSARDELEYIEITSKE